MPANKHVERFLDENTKYIVGDVSTIENESSKASEISEVSETNEGLEVNEVPATEISPSYLLHTLETNPHEACKKHGLYFIKVKGEWTINSCSRYEDQYLNNSEVVAEPEPKDSIFDKIYGISRLAVDNANVLYKSVFDNGFFKKRQAVQAKQAKLLKEIDEVGRVLEGDRYLYESSKRILRTLYAEGAFPQKDQDYLMRTYRNIVDNELRLSMLNTNIKMLAK